MMQVMEILIPMPGGKPIRAISGAISARLMIPNVLPATRKSTTSPLMMRPVQTILLEDGAAAVPAFIVLSRDVVVSSLSLRDYVTIHALQIEELTPGEVLLTSSSRLPAFQILLSGSA